MRFYVTGITKHSSKAQVAQANGQLLQAHAQVSQAQANQVKTQLDVNKYAPLAEQKAAEG